MKLSKHTKFDVNISPDGSYEIVITQNSTGDFRKKGEIDIVVLDNDEAMKLIEALAKL